uniref:Si:ch211-214j8.12 n=2 Tax=Nothobranchius kuhntae TaxID=321403 RepID=A0A1A8J3A9_NOTKU
MPLFRALDEQAGVKVQPRRRKGFGRRAQDDSSVFSLKCLCLSNVADNMKDVWVKDYADNYLDQYTFRYIMGPFNILPGDLIEELMLLLCSRKQLSRAALHLLLVPQLRGLTLEKCSALVTPGLCAHIAARCQGLFILDLSGAKQIPSKVLCETIHRLPALRSLSLAGVPCDRSVIQTIACCCRSLKHLDVSRCHLLFPAALLPLGGVYPASSSSSSSLSSVSSSVLPSITPAPCPLPLSSLLALDIGFTEQGEDSTVAAAYLLLSLPYLERAALEGLSQACCLLEQEEFSRADGFAEREGVPRLEEVWRERIQWQGKTSEDVASGERGDEREEEEGMYLEEDENDTARDEKFSFQSQTEGKSEFLSQSGLVFQLKDVRGVTSDSLQSLGRLCPGIRSITMNIDGNEHSSGRGRRQCLLDLQTWSGQLQTLSFHYNGPLADFLLPLQVAGSRLISLSLDGVKTSPYSPLLEVIRACPRLRDLLISAEPPSLPQEQDENDQLDNVALPQLPHLCSLSLSFSYEHSQMKPVMSWMSLKKVLRCLLIGSPLLEKLSLVSLPCPLDCVLQDTLQSVNLNSPDVPLGRLERVDLKRTDVQMITVKSLIQLNKRLKHVDVSYCWQISQLQWSQIKRARKVEVVWV